MFALLALAGDAGGTLGPWFAGVLAAAADAPLAPLTAALPADGGSGLRPALLLCAAVPAAFCLAVTRFRTGRVAEEPVAA
jgi:hypothetical protein